MILSIIYSMLTQKQIEIQKKIQEQIKIQKKTQKQIEIQKNNLKESIDYFFLFYSKMDSISTVFENEKKKINNQDNKTKGNVILYFLYSAVKKLIDSPANCRFSFDILKSLKIDSQTDNLLNRFFNEIYKNDYKKNLLQVIYHLCDYILIQRMICGNFNEYEYFLIFNQYISEFTEVDEACEFVRTQKSIMQNKQENEQLRQENEQLRQENEQSRQKNEQLRQKNEQLIQENEQLRQKNKQENTKIQQKNDQLKKQAVEIIQEKIEIQKNNLKQSIDLIFSKSEEINDQNNTTKARVILYFFYSSVKTLINSLGINRFSNDILESLKINLQFENLLSKVFEKIYENDSKENLLLAIYRIYDYIILNYILKYIIDQHEHISGLTEIYEACKVIQEQKSIMINAQFIGEFCKYGQENKNEQNKQENEQNKQENEQNKQENEQNRQKNEQNSAIFKYFKYETDKHERQIEELKKEMKQFQENNIASQTQYQPKKTKFQQLKQTNPPLKVIQEQTEQSSLNSTP